MTFASQATDIFRISVNFIDTSTENIGTDKTKNYKPAGHTQWIFERT